jgi:uncharacterized damage-inducible protein DinB
MERNRIDDFATGGRKLIRAIDGLSREDLLWQPPPQLQIGRWSIQQVVFHLMDDELIWTDRMKRVIAEENPKILNYDESKFAAKLFTEAQDAAVAAEILDLNRRQLAIVLRNLPAAAFARTGDHNDIGIFTLEQAVGWTAEHLDHHIYYIAMKREKLGKPLKD